MRTVTPCLLTVFSIGAALLGSAVCSAQAVAPHGSWGPVTQGFALHLEVPQASTAAGVSQPEAALERQVALRLSLQNVTLEPLLVTDARPEVDYDLTLTDAFGELMKPLEPPLPVYRNTIAEVQAGETLTQDYDLTTVYGLLPDGGYTIVARRYVSRLDGEGDDEVESNPIAIVISGGQATQVAVRPAGGGANGVAGAKGSQLARRPGLLAARPILERHGFRVSWDPAKQTLTATNGKVVATIQAHQKVMMLDKQETPMAKPAEVVKGQLSAPGQAISMITSLASQRAARAPRANG